MRQIFVVPMGPTQWLDPWVDIWESEFWGCYIWLAPLFAQIRFFWLWQCLHPSICRRTVVRSSLRRIAVANRIRMWSNKSLDHTTRKKDFAAAASATATVTGQVSAQGANIIQSHECNSLSNIWCLNLHREASSFNTFFQYFNLCWLLLLRH